MSKTKTILISIGILIAGALVTFLIFQTEPTSQPGGASKKTAMLVDVVTVQRDTFQPTIVATGTVEPSRDVNLSPRVSGEIIDRSHKFVPGSFVQKGERLLQIDPSDYKNALLQEKSNLRQALADMNIEQGRQDVARQDLELVGDTILENLSARNEDLVLRKPQLESVKADIEAARAAVEQAKLNLQRTTIKAPFDAHIISRNVNVGSQVAPGENMGRLVGMDEYWVSVTVPLSKLRWLRFPDDNSHGAKVEINNETAWPQEQSRTGYLYKRVGTLEDRTRMARVLVTVPDPLAYETDHPDTPSLTIGAFVEVHIRAREIPNVVRMNRDHMRKDNTVWVYDEGELRIRKVDIVFKDAQYAYIKSGLKDGEQVVTTNLSTVVDGSPLRLGGSDTTSQ